MPKTLADARTLLIALTTKPADLANITAAELALGVNLSSRILKSDYRLSATASDTVPDTELSAEGNAVTFGASNYEGSVTPFRYLTGAGQADTLNDVAYDLLKTKGTLLWFVEREGPLYTTALANGDRYECYEAITDNPQKPSDRNGYIKRVVPLGVQRKVDGIVAGTAVVPLIVSATPTAQTATKMVTITGALFTGATSVKFGATEATAFTVVSPEIIIASVPTGSAGAANITVTTPAGVSTAFAYTRGA